MMIFFFLFPSTLLIHLWSTCVFKWPYIWYGRDQSEFRERITFVQKFGQKDFSCAACHQSHICCTINYCTRNYWLQRLYYVILLTWYNQPIIIVFCASLYFNSFPPSYVVLTLSLVNCIPNFSSLSST